jgi:hypothetical protein
MRNAADQTPSFAKVQAPGAMPPEAPFCHWNRIGNYFVTNNPMHSTFFRIFKCTSQPDRDILQYTILSCEDNAQPQEAE